MDPAFLTIAELSRLYDQRELSPVEVTRNLFDRIAAHDSKLHSFIRVTAEVALAEAQAAERELMAGRRRGLLHGIPYALKDIVETRRHSEHRPLEAVPRLCPSRRRASREPVESRRCGIDGQARYLGIRAWRTELGPALAAGAQSVEPRLSARRLVERRRGGSCGGVCPGAVGTDTGGSIRGPAAVCGIAGLKPTYGRVSRRGVFPNTFTMDHCGPLTRSAEDIALFLQVIAGFDAEDPGGEDAPVPDYVAALTRPITGLRLGLIEHWYADGAHPDLPPAMSAAIEVLRGLGAIVEPVQLSSLRDYTDCKTTISIAELYAIHEKDLKTRPQDFGRILRNRVLPGALIRAEDYVQALRWRTVLAREQAMALKQFDALLTAGALGVADPADPDLPDRLVSAPSITMPLSVGGLPALAIPCGFSRAEGLPLSMQIAAAPMAEPIVLRIAHAYQQATDWHRRHPDLH